MLTPDQRYIKTMMLMGFVASVAIMTVAWFIAPLLTFNPIHNLPVRLWAFIWSIAISSLPLFAFIALISYQRFFGAGISGDHSDPKVEISARVLNNTHEQFTLLIVVLLLLVVGLPEIRLAMAPYLAIAFNISRVLFWWGYQKRPVARSFGFALGFYINILGAILSIFLLMTPF